MSYKALEQELGSCDSSGWIVRGFNLQRRELLEQALNLPEISESRGTRLVIVQLHRASQVEPLLDLLCVDFGKVAVVDLANSGADELANDSVGATHLALVLEFQLACDSRKRGIDVADAGDRRVSPWTSA